MNTTILPDGWVRMKLGEVTTKIGSGATPRGGKASYKTEGISLIRSMNVHDFEFREKNLAFIDDVQAEALSNVTLEENDVLFNITGASIARCCVVPNGYLPARVNQHVSIIRARKDIILPSLLNLILTSSFYKKQLLATGEKGATRQAITKAQLESFEIKFPKSISEQQLIVDKIYKAFAAITKAKANAEQNLKNAKELFESYLNKVFAEGPIQTTIGDQIALQRGFDITKKQQIEGLIPVVSSGGIKSFHNEAMVQAPGVVIGRKGTLGKVFYLEDDFWPHDTTLWVKDFKNNNERYVYYFLMSLDVQKLDSGAANPALNRNQVHPIKINWFPVSQQQKIVQILDGLSLETENLKIIYLKKIVDIEELKKSILEKAFKGEL